MSGNPVVCYAECSGRGGWGKNANALHEILRYIETNSLTSVYTAGIEGQTFVSAWLQLSSVTGLFNWLGW